MKVLQTLQAINSYHSAHNTCALKKTAAQAVYGAGNPHASVVFIGEAPGKKEDIEGTPFIGAAGKLLNELLHSIGMDRADIYITNIVKYRPPNNRDPLPAEKSACAAWLSAELGCIKPKLIVFLGRHALHHFFPEESISVVHGTLLTKTITGIPTTYFLPLYHPAAALYNGGLRETLFTDFKKIKSLRKKYEAY
ncbi:MAG: uracil-DNA glycosylase [Candidatus Pacearchaeota archaeon]